MIFYYDSSLQRHNVDAQYVFKPSKAYFNSHKKNELNQNFIQNRKLKVLFEVAFLPKLCL